VTDVVYPYIKGGAEKRIYELSRRLAASGHEVHVFSVKWWDGPSVKVEDGITYHGVCKPRKLYEGDRRSIVEALAFGLFVTVPLIREKFDVIDCNQHPYFSMFSCKLASLLRGERFYATWHEVWGNYWYDYIGKAGFFGKLIERITARLPDRIIAVSVRTANELAGIGVRRERIVVVPNGFGSESIQTIGPSTAIFDVAFAGRLIKDKHVDVLIRACAEASKTRPLKLIVIGDGPERKSLETLTSELHMEDSVAFTGLVEEGSLIASIKGAKTFVLPSTREGFSITTLEALACGVPVITVNGEKNSAQELVEHRVTGLIVGLSEKELAKAILDILGDEPERKRMSDRCFKSIERFDWDVVATGLLEIYQPAH
ncbi:MAG TPA: glycosyltransferase family 4 protein, partial [Methanocellaceae archaeon]